MELSKRAKSLDRSKRKEELLPVKRAATIVRVETEMMTTTIGGWSVYRAHDMYMEENVVNVDDDDDEDDDDEKEDEKRSTSSSTRTADTSLPTSPSSTSSSSGRLSSTPPSLTDSPFLPAPCRRSSSSTTTTSSSSYDNEGGVLDFLNFDWEDVQDFPEDRMDGRPLRPETGKKSVFVDAKDGNTCSVEQLALEHYASEEEGSWWGVHCEGGMVRALFGILMWDIIFLSVPGVFQSPFQDAPLDLDHPMLFYRNREVAIEARLAQLAGMAPQKLAREVLQGFEDHYQTLCRAINWDRVCVEVLQGAAMALGGHGLAVAFRPLCASFRYYSGG